MKTFEIKKQPFMSNPFAYVITKEMLTGNIDYEACYEEMEREKNNVIEAEQSIIGCAVSGYNKEELAHLVQLAAQIGFAASDFYREDFGCIFQCVQSLVDAGEEVDLISVFGEIEKLRKNPSTSDGVPYYLDLAYLNEVCRCSYIMSRPSLHKCMLQVLQRSKFRQKVVLFQWLNDAVALAPDDEAVDVLVEEAALRWDAIRGSLYDRAMEDWLTMKQGVSDYMEVLDQRSKGEADIWPTGMQELDKTINGGLRPGSLYVVAARPGQGKSALALSIATHVAREQPVGFFSLEMSRTEIFDRLIASMGEIPLQSLLNPQEVPLDWGKAVDVARDAGELKLCLSDKSGLNINEIRVKARSLQKSHGLKVLVVDYLGLLAPSKNTERAARHQQIEEASRGLKALAQELGIAVVALAQVNRNVQSRACRKPQLADLRDSGAIEQDADVVLGLYRAAMDSGSSDVLDARAASLAELLVLKNRQGPSGGCVNLFYRASCVRFTSWQGDVPKVAAHAAPSPYMRKAASYLRH